MNNIEKTKSFFYSNLKGKERKYYWMEKHVPSVEKMAKKILTIKTEADEETVLLGVWLHDIGVLTHGLEVDHAPTGEKVAREFLQSINLDKEKIEAVGHCVRAHRNKDVEPSTLEAKIIATADSLSHMIETTYIDIAARGELEFAKQKLERDYRDKALIPEIALDSDFEELYKAWRHLLEVFPRS